MSLQAVLWAILGFVGGALVSAQISANTVLQRYVGFWDGILFMNLVGMLTATVIIAFAGKGNWSAIAHAPWYSLLGGAMGVFIVAISTFIVPKIGVLAGISVFLFGQMLSATLIDTIGALGQRSIPISFERALGLILLLVGSWLVLARG